MIQGNFLEDDKFKKYSYFLTVTIAGDILNEANAVKDGMIMDFTDLKKIVKEHVVDVFDHALLVNGNTPHAKYAEVENGYAKIILCDYQPTCENMLMDMVARLQANMPDGITLMYVRLQETQSSYAEWLEGENL